MVLHEPAIELNGWDDELYLVCPCGLKEELRFAEVLPVVEVTRLAGEHVRAAMIAEGEG